MWTISQILTIAGLFFEFLSVLLVAWQVFYPKKKLKKQMIEKMGRTMLQRAGEKRAQAFLTLLFLGIGMVLQGIAVFI